jgi:prepilin-type N-terminal cleavage/methylation domain-containing protein
MRRARGSSGFTVIELIVALTIAGIALVGAALLLEQVAAIGDRVVGQAAAHDRAGNLERLLRATLRQYTPIADSVPSFDGREDHLWLATWCATASGWQERCDATVAIDSIRGRPVIALALSTGETEVLRDGFGRAAFRYLRDPAAGGSWLRSWGRSTSAPAAVGIVVDTDTLILPVGGDR